MKTSLNVRFGVAAVLISAGCALLLVGVYSWPLFGLALLFWMPRSELVEPIPRHELWGMVGITAALIAVLYLLPSSAADLTKRVLSHPAFVVPFWLCVLWGLYRHWRIQKRGANA
ncbi:MAG: hypothetical protein NT154_24165 [Verrucomicrobia bacterium]|nr:hypothetical protein [Verrucomicrobiota bacterium]